MSSFLLCYLLVLKQLPKSINCQPDLFQLPNDRILCDWSLYCWLWGFHLSINKNVFLYYYVKLLYIIYFLLKWTFLFYHNRYYKLYKNAWHMLYFNEIFHFINILLHARCYAGTQSPKMFKTQVTDLEKLIALLKLWEIFKNVSFVKMQT